MNEELEISIGVKIEAGIYFTVETAAWLTMTNDERRALINDRLNSASNQLANNTIYVGDCALSGQIVSPSYGVEEIDLKKVEAYDKESGLYDTSHLDPDTETAPTTPEGWKALALKHGWIELDADPDHPESGPCLFHPTLERFWPADDYEGACRDILTGF